MHHVETGAELPAIEDLTPYSGIHERAQWRWIPIEAGVAFVLTVAATLATLLEAPSFLRVPLGILLVLVLPGIALTAALFASNDGPDGPARVALSVALSLASIPPLALAIDWSPWRLERTSLSLGLLAITTVAFVAAVVHGSRLPPAERYRASIPRLSLPPRSEWTREYGYVAVAAVVIVSMFAVGSFDVIKTRITGQPMTEMAMYNSSGEARYYPREIAIGSPAEVRISVANHEGKSVHYVIVVAGAGTAVGTSPDFTLDDGEKWTGPVRFTVNEVGDELPVRFELHDADSTDRQSPHRSLVLVVSGQEDAGS